MKVWWCEEHQCSGYRDEPIVLVDGRITEGQAGESCWAYQYLITEYYEFVSFNNIQPPKGCRMVEVVLTRRDTEPFVNQQGLW